MKYFSVPADFRIETIDKLNSLNNSVRDSKIIETYGQVTVGNVLCSGRVVEALPRVEFKKLEEYVGYSRERGIDFDYTLNPACMGNMEFSEAGIKELITLLHNLYNIGVRSLTVTVPPLIELIKASGLTFNMKASAICEINSPTKGLFYKNSGVGRAVVDPDITRDFRKLRSICQVFGEGVEIIINNVCFRNCAYKMFHYNHEAHSTHTDNSQSVRNYYFYRCFMQKASILENVIKLNWIRPEDLKFYQEAGIKYFKIQGRQNVLKGDIIRTLKAYMEEEFDGNLYDLITIFAPYNDFQPYIDNKKLDGFVKTFYENPDFCSEVCNDCKYCKGYAHKSMDREKTDKINQSALQFYGTHDRYGKLIKDVCACHGKPESSKKFEDYYY